MARHDDQPKMSDICGTCRGSGSVTVQRQRVEKDANGKDVSVSYPNVEVCSGCGGLGEYPTVG